MPSIRSGVPFLAEKSLVFRGVAVHRRGHFSISALDSRRDQGHGCALSAVIRASSCCHWHYLGTGPAPDSSRSRPAAPSSAYFAPDRVGSWDSIRRDGDGIHAGCWAIRSASAAPNGSRAMWLNQCPTSRPYCLQRRFSGSKSLAN